MYFKVNRHLIYNFYIIYAFQLNYRFFIKLMLCNICYAKVGRLFRKQKQNGIFFAKKYLPQSIYKTISVFAFVCRCRWRNTFCNFVCFLQQ